MLSGDELARCLQPAAPAMTHPPRMPLAVQVLLPSLIAALGRELTHRAPDELARGFAAELRKQIDPTLAPLVSEMLAALAVQLVDPI